MGEEHIPTICKQSNIPPLRLPCPIFQDCDWKSPKLEFYQALALYMLHVTHSHKAGNPEWYRSTELEEMVRNRGHEVEQLMADPVDMKF